MAAPSRKVKVGIIGCGNIAPAYIKGLRMFEIVELTRLADMDVERAKARAEEFAVPAHGDPSSVLNDPDIEIVVNLTVPDAHAPVNIDILNAGKSAVTEKPFATNRADGKKVLALAAEKKLRVGCAPDTFLGAGLQTVRKIIDDGWIGRPFGATAHMMGMGPESWHPNPAFFYAPGGGPLLDMGPYYITALVSLLGPVTRVQAANRKAREERVATSKEAFGQVLPVSVPTFVCGLLEFAGGAAATLNMSFDVQGHKHPCIEIYGTEGSVAVPDPNTFGGPVRVRRQGNDDWMDMPLSHGYKDNSRGIGPADMAYGLVTGRAHRASGALAYHVLDVMLSVLDAGEPGAGAVTVESTVERPAPFPLGLIPGRLDD